MPIYILLYTKSLKPAVYFTLTTHLSSDAECSLEIFDLRLNLITFTVGKVGSHTQIVLNTFKSFPINESTISFKIRINHN